MDRGTGWTGAASTVRGWRRQFTSRAEKARPVDRADNADRKLGPYSFPHHVPDQHVAAEIILRVGQHIVVRSVFVCVQRSEASLIVACKHEEKVS